MSNFRQLIKAIQKRIEQNDLSAETHMRLLGERLSSIDSSKISKSPLRNVYLKVKTVVADSAKLQESFEKLQGFISQLDEVNSELRKLRRQKFIKEKEIPNYFRQVGTASTKVFLDNRKNGKAYNDLFAKAASSVRGIRSIEKQIADSKMHNKASILLKALGRGKRLFLGTLLKRNRVRQSRLLQSVGEKVCDSDFAVRMADEGLSRAIGSAGEFRRETQRLAGREERLKEKKMTLQNEIAQLGIKGDPQKSTKEMIANLRNEKERLDNAFRVLGKTALTLDIELIKNFEDQETIKIIKRLNELEKANREYERQMKRLEATLKIRQINERISATEAHLQHLKSVVERKTNQINSLGRLITEMENQRNRLARIRGSEDTLIKSLPAKKTI